MAKGIVVFGAPGAGDTTLGRALALRLGVPHFDSDDFCWRWDTKIPYTALRPAEEIERNLTEAIAGAGHFILSGSFGSLRHAFTPLFMLAVHITAPADIRVARLRARTFAQFGGRVLEGGDMFVQNNGFIENAARYETNGRLQQHEEWIGEMPCPVLRVDGRRGVSENMERVLSAYGASMWG